MPLIRFGEDANKEKGPIIEFWVLLVLEKKQIVQLAVGKKLVNSLATVKPPLRKSPDLNSSAQECRPSA